MRCPDCNSYRYLKGNEDRTCPKCGGRMAPVPYRRQEFRYLNKRPGVRAVKP